jgi:SEL1 protein
MHEFGAGVPKDLSLALRFYNMALHTSKDAALAVYCARAWLAIHSAWEWVLPHIPAKYRHMVEQIGTLHPPHTSVLGAWARILGSSLPGSQMLRAELGLWQWVDSTGVGQILGWAGQELGNEVGDTALLAALLLLLYLVLRLRRNRAAARRLLGTDEEARQRMIAEQVRAGGGRVSRHQVLNGHACIWC